MAYKFRRPGGRAKPSAEARELIASKQQAALRYVQRCEKMGWIPPQRYLDQLPLGDRISYEKIFNKKRNGDD